MDWKTSGLISNCGILWPIARPGRLHVVGVFRLRCAVLGLGGQGRQRPVGGDAIQPLLL